MKKPAARLSICLVILLSLIKVAVSETESSLPEAQIIVLTDKTQRFAWQEGMTLGQALMKIGGTSARSVFLIRLGKPERVKVTPNLGRKLEAWDILLIGIHPVPKF
jgi:hypothetical protein